MKIREIIIEAQVGAATLGPGGRVNVPTTASSTLDQRPKENEPGPTRVDMPKDAQGRPIEPGLEPSPIDPIDFLPAGRIAGAARMASATEKGLASRVGTRAAEIGKDIKDLPSPYKPWTWSKIGKVDADTMADKAYREKFGTNFDHAHWDAAQMRELNKLQKNYIDRGYPASVNTPPAGHLIKQPGYTEFYNKNPHPPGSPEHLDWNRKAYEFEVEHGRPTRQKSGLQHANQAVKDVVTRAGISAGADLTNQATRSIPGNQPSTVGKK